MNQAYVHGDVVKSKGPCFTPALTVAWGVKIKICRLWARLRLLSYGEFMLMKLRQK